MLNKIKFNLVILIFFVCLKLNSANNILILSVPKCGTHLAAKAVELLTGKKLEKEVLPDKILKKGLSIINNPKKIFRCHLMYNNAIKNQLLKNNFKVLFIYRDPRDQIISSAYWIMKGIKNSQKLSGLTADQIIDFQIKRLPFNYVYNYNTTNMQKLYPYNFSMKNMIDSLILRVRDYYSFFMKWKDKKNICSIKSENLVGSYGNGNDQLQKNEIKKICKFLGINSENLVNHCIKNLFGGTRTFREGKVGYWKKYFTSSQINIFNKLNNNLLINLGYN